MLDKFKDTLGLKLSSVLNLSRTNCRGRLANAAALAKPTWREVLSHSGRDDGAVDALCPDLNQLIS